MTVIDTATQVCAVIGNPVEHSLSPAMHNAAFRHTGLNYVYVAFRVEDLCACLAGVRAFLGFRGLSVTIPHKLAILQYLDEIEPMARDVGSVNTVTHEGDKLIGSTTDGLGALRAFDDAGIGLRGKRVLFIGAGGAARAVAFAVARLSGAAGITILGRTVPRVAALAGDLRAGTPLDAAHGDLDTDLADALASHHVIIQSTPLGMYPNSIGDTPIPASLLRSDHVVFDMVYRPFKTRLLQEAENVGCRTIAGAEMLVNQAVVQFETWTGVAAPVDVMRNALIAALDRQTS